MDGNVEKKDFSLTEITDENWEIYPNPSIGIINLSIHFPALEMTGILKIQDIHGRNIKTLSDVRTGEYSIDLSSEPKGTYLFILTNDDQSKTVFKQMILH